MARIRSIKPDFFTSEVIASLSLSARLTFIGLWTYVDDNGVGLDNERLILAAIWPLEDDVVMAIRRIREDLRSLSRAGSEGPLIMRYQGAGRRYLYITHWEEHQRVSHPGKPRYPLPGEPGLTCVNDVSGDPPESRGRHSGEFRESLPPRARPEQGAGSREQGKEQGAGTPMAEAVNSNVEAPPLAVAELPSEPWRNGYLEPNGATASPRSDQKENTDAPA